tara:strand:- start:82 stop:447 length:366 start_codon:yes stop_codon:yes gene_type:complete
MVRKRIEPRQFTFDLMDRSTPTPMDSEKEPTTVARQNERRVDQVLDKSQLVVSNPELLDSVFSQSPQPTDLTQLREFIVWFQADVTVNALWITKRFLHPRTWMHAFGFRSFTKHYQLSTAP